MVIQFKLQLKNQLVVVVLMLLLVLILLLRFGH